MPDPSPDTPSVCPTCDDTGLVAPLGGRGSDGPDPCPHCTPAAGSSSPDTAALVARLRGAASMFAEDPDGTAWVVTPDTTLLADLRAAVAQLRQLDRIKAALGDVDLSHGFFLSRHADACSYCSNGLVDCETADLIERIADALEADDGA